MSLDTVQAVVDDLVVFCAWCNPQRVLRLPQRAGDEFLITHNMDGRISVRRRREGELFRELPISDTICESCRERLRP